MRHINWIWSEGQLVKVVSDISDNDWKKRKLRQKHWVSGRGYGSIKSIALIFMIECNIDGEQKGYIVTWFLVKSLSIISWEKLSSSREIIKQSNLMFQSPRCWGKWKSSSGSYRYLTHTTDKAMMERKTRNYEVQKLFIVEYDTDGSRIYNWRAVRNLVQGIKLKGTVKPEKVRV